MNQMTDKLSVSIPQAGDPRKFLSRIMFDGTSLIANIEDEELRTKLVGQLSDLVTRLAYGLGLKHRDKTENEAYDETLEDVIRDIATKRAAIELARKRDKAGNN